MELKDFFEWSEAVLENFSVFNQAKEWRCRSRALNVKTSKKVDVCPMDKEGYDMCWHKDSELEDVAQGFPAGSEQLFGHRHILESLSVLRLRVHTGELSRKIQWSTRLYWSPLSWEPTYSSPYRLACIPALAPIL